MRILRAADYRRMPWKNGKGETVEIAVFPPEAKIDNFEWRISMATVIEDGPFSLFEGVERTLSVLSGEGIALSVAGWETVDLTIDSVPHAFPADVETSARLLGTPITDLNVMTRRGYCSNTVESITATPLLVPVVGHVIVFCRSGFLRVAAAGEHDTLSGLDCAMFEPGEIAKLAGDGRGFLIHIR